MGKKFDTINERLKAFIEAQKIFFVATAASDGRVNVSPKGCDSLRILNGNRLIWLNLTGSGNETAAHVQENPRMTLMFTAFSGNPLIVRLYGQAECVHAYDAKWSELYPLFPEIPGARQIFDVTVDFVQSSCGFAVPYFDYVSERDQLTKWADKKGESGIREYWRERNTHSIDGKPTYVLEAKDEPPLSD